MIDKQDEDIAEALEHLRHAMAAYEASGNNLDERDRLCAAAYALILPVDEWYLGDKPE